MDTLIVDHISYYLPISISDVQFLITRARRKKIQIRVRGSNHSIPDSIYPDLKDPVDEDSIYVLLSKMNGVTINIKTQTVIVEAGCHLGYDPYDPANISTWENSLFAQLDKAGFAIPDMGGIIHQTVGGFLSTGSAGGSTTYSFLDALKSITFFPADSDYPQPQTVSVNDELKPGELDIFHAIGVSMGLLGIIVSATFSLVPRFNITGSEEITAVKDCNIDMSGKEKKGKISMRQFLTTTEYTRILWYPQPKVPRVTVWKARQLKPEEPFNRKPYSEFTPIFGSQLLPQIIADAVYSGIGRWPNWLGDLIGTNNKSYNDLTSFVHEKFYDKIFPRILPLFVKNDGKRKKHSGFPQVFEDYWYSGLCMDNNVNDKIFPVEFTELWIPFEEDGDPNIITDVLKTLNGLFKKLYQDKTVSFPGGDFSIELYAAKKNSFWMSPSYESHTFRVDVFWFKNNIGNPGDKLYYLFWEALHKFNFRCHWGKHLPPSKSKQGTEYLKQQYPKYSEFLKLRSTLDPLGVFLSTYWKEHLGI